MSHQRSSAAVYQIGLRIYRGGRLLAEPQWARLLCVVLGGARRQLGFRLYAYVVLPDRLRMIVGTHDGHPDTVGLIVRRMKSRFAREVNGRRRRSGRVWDDADHLYRIGSPAAVVRRIGLLHRSPIAARLARRPRDWRWSSYRAWSGEGGAPLGIDPPDGVVIQVI